MLPRSLVSCTREQKLEYLQQTKAGLLEYFLLDLHVSSLDFLS